MLVFCKKKGTRILGMPVSGFISVASFAALTTVVLLRNYPDIRRYMKMHMM